MVEHLFTNGAAENLTPIMIIINIVFSLALGLITAIVYRVTHKGLSYSQSFTVTLVLMSIIASVALMVIGNSLARAFGMAGALGIIRFRTVIKDPKDIAYVFWSLIIGMACGTHMYAVGLISTILIAIIILVLSKINFGSIRKHDYILRFNHTSNTGNDDAIQELFRKYTKSIIMLNMNAHEGGKIFEFSYNVQFINDVENNQMVKELSALEGIENTYLLAASNDIEY